MEINVYTLGHIAANCYTVLSADSALVIDPGQFSDAVANFLNQNADKQRLILLTHSHFDHICGAERLRSECGAEIAIGENDAEGLTNTALSLSDKFHARQKPFNADVLLKDNQDFLIGDLNIKCIETPGHTRGGMCYLCENKLFSGDTLFLETVGRTDFPGADHSTLLNSLKKLTVLDENTVVYPGHGNITTIKHEKEFNPYIRGSI